MSKTVNASTAKSNFGECLRWSAREPVTIEKNHKPVAVLISIEDYERLSMLEDKYWIERAQKAEAGGYAGEEESMAFLKGLVDEKS